MHCQVIIRTRPWSRVDNEGTASEDVNYSGRNNDNATNLFTTLHNRLDKLWPVNLDINFSNRKTE